MKSIMSMRTLLKSNTVQTLATVPVLDIFALKIAEKRFFTQLDAYMYDRQYNERIVELASGRESSSRSPPS